MFTGIVQGVGTVVARVDAPGLVRLTVTLPEAASAPVQIGASVSVAGVCLTVEAQTNGELVFAVIQETLDRTNLGELKVGDSVNIERAAKYGDEIGGHQVSGHVFGVAKIADIKTPTNNQVVTLSCPREWFKYILPKGYLALDGASLTIVNPSASAGTFEVHLIPETLAITTFGKKQVGDLVNVEFDVTTQTIVDTTERVLTIQNKGNRII